MPVNFYWIIIAKEPYHYQSVPISFALLYNVVFIMFVLVGINFLLRKFFRNGALSQGELLTIHLILSFTTTVGGMDMMQILPCVMEHAFGFSTVENEWGSLFHHYIPEWLSVRDKRVLAGYYEGNSSLYTKQHLLGWITPVLSWVAFILVLLLVMLSINVIFRRRWTEEEKLTYPIIELPYQLTSENFFNSQLLWLAFGIAAALDIVNGLHVWSPSIPGLFEKVYRFRFC